MDKRTKLCAAIIYERTALIMMMHHHHHACMWRRGHAESPTPLTGAYKVMIINDGGVGGFGV